MFRLALAVLCVAVAVQAKTRRPFPLPESVRNDKKLFNLPDEKIVGGTAVAAGDRKYQVSVQDGTFHFCGGAIYNENWVICAGHCISTGDSVTVVAGFLDMNDQSNAQRIDSASTLQHPEYSSFDLTNDISLIELSSALEFGEMVGAATMPDLQEEFTGDAVVSGWGTTSSGGSPSDILLEVTVPIVSDEVCNENYDGGVFESMICAGEEGKDSCQGDSGGPMTCEGEVHCGIVSWGIGCAQAGFPGVYTQTSYFVDWIGDNTGGI